jgi:hypothetical protein
MRLLAQPVDQSSQRNRLDLKEVGKFGLLEPFVPLQTEQHRPLRARHAEAARFLVGAGSQQPGGIAQQERKISLRREIWH